jgi:hypothetical protein
MTKSSDYLIEYLHQALDQDLLDGLQAWSTMFDQLLEGWQIPDCQQLLREVKHFALS